MVGWLKALLFVVGGTVAAAGTAYVTGLLDPLLGRQPAVVAALPQAQQPSQPQAPAAAPEAVPTPAPEPHVTEKQDRLVLPSFDLLRVEPDGSMLIAGKAAPQATVDVLHGDEVLMTTTADATGDFVAVLDRRLAPGDYRLALRSIAGDVVALSEETAIVSVPEATGGQVLAMVEAPGAPAQLITIPEATADSSTTTTETEVAAAPVVDSNETAAPAQEETAAAAPQEAPAAPEVTQAPAATPQDEQTTAEAPGAAEPETEAVAGANEPAPADAQIAAAPAPTEPVAEQPVVNLTVVVEAVEIEGDTIFVAGQAAPGRTVRVYADDMLIGDALVSEGGRFLVEERRELPVGNYTIRADLLDASGAVLARAAVPFEREAGEAIAAIAAPAQPSPQAAPTEVQTSQAPVAPQQPATGGSDAPAAPQAQSAAVTAPALQRVDGAVIIRRGDSLWRISRRVYGHGVRYSTIYLANQDQISNPDRIWPGQVFSVPQETSEGEQADMGAMGDQAVSRDAQPVAQ